MTAAVTNIRPAHAHDVECCVGLLADLFSLEADFAVDAARQRRGLELLLGAPGACLLVAEDGGAVVGMCSIQLLVSTAEGGPSALVEDVVVAPGARGRGVGKALVRAAEQWSLDHGAGRLQLLADQGNTPALKFYGRIGWEPTRLACLRRRPALGE